MLQVTERRLMNNEYANSRISKLSPVSLIAKSINTWKEILGAINW